MTTNPLYTDTDVTLVADAFVATARRNPVSLTTPPWAGVQTRLMLGPNERDIARAVLDALASVGRLAPTGPCPCTCHRPDDCPCGPLTPTHRHGAGRYCTVADQTGHDPADPREAADRLYIAATAVEANLRRDLNPADLPADHVELIQALAAYPAPSAGRHVLVVAADGTWTVDHPAGCTIHTPTGPAVICVVHDLAVEQLPAGLPGGRYEIAANDLGDRLLIGDRLDPPAHQPGERPSLECGKRLCGGCDGQSAGRGDTPCTCTCHTEG
ncbi:hypothetical protein ACFUYE_05240 [Micromonospora humida]|uniref:hypothetical protein n=1 Tax=Micromonospora humida TaxID=2809018 RepID=UPI003671414B